MASASETKPEFRFHPSGDQYLTLDLRNEMTLANTLRVLALDEEIRKEKIQGIRETVATWRSILIHFDPLESDPELLMEHITRVASRERRTHPIPSRVVHIPVRYGGRWGKDLGFVAEVNRLSIEEAISRHAGSRHLVGMISCTPGQANCMFLDISKTISAPKYREPRTYTPEGVIGLGGSSTCIYSVAAAGGFQMIGYTPLPIYDPWERLPQFDGPVLLRVADQLQFISVDEDEMADIAQQVREARYMVKIENTTLDAVDAAC